MSSQFSQQLTIADPRCLDAIRLYAGQVCERMCIDVTVVEESTASDIEFDGQAVHAVSVRWVARSPGEAETDTPAGFDDEQELEAASLRSWISQYAATLEALARNSEAAGLFLRNEKSKARGGQTGSAHDRAKHNRQKGEVHHE